MAAKLIRGGTKALLMPVLFLAILGFAQSGPLELQDAKGHRVEHLAGPETRVVVLMFAATDCPISNRYIPEIARLQRAFGARNVAFWWVFPNPGDTAAVVRKHELDYSMHEQAIMDSKQELVRLAHVAVTPEAAVFAVDKGALRETYHGRVDDLYYAFGKAKPTATHHDLQDAIDAALVGRASSPPAHGPVGCSIVPLTQRSAGK